MFELHQLLTKGKLTKSAGMLKDCIDICRENKQSIDEGKTQSSTGGLRSQRSRSNNKNQNAILEDDEHDEISFNFGKRPAAQKSDKTIYKKAVRQRGSSSSEDDLVNTSDEFTNNLNDLIIAGRREAAAADNTTPHRSPQVSRGATAVTPQQQGHKEVHHKTPQEKADEMILDAERAKANIFPNQGRSRDHDGNKCNGMIDVVNYQSTARMDES